MNIRDIDIPLGLSPAGGVFQAPPLPERRHLNYRGFHFGPRSMKMTREAKREE